MPAVVMSSDLHDTETDVHRGGRLGARSLPETSIGEEVAQSLMGATFTSGR